MPECPICGKKLKNPSSPSHLNSQFHKSNIPSKKEQEDKTQPIPSSEQNEEFTSQDLTQIEELKLQLKENIIDVDGNLKINELKLIEESGGVESTLLEQFLREEDYQIEFTSIEELISILNSLMNYLQVEEILSILHKFNNTTLDSQLEDDLSEIEQQILSTSAYTFDILVKFIAKSLPKKAFINFLTYFSDLEQVISKSYYEENDSETNPTLLMIENLLTGALKGEDQELYNDTVYIIQNSGCFFEHLRKELEGTFRINKYITLKLVGNRTNIYVNNRLFNQCKYLLLNIPKSRIREYRQIDSIDEAAERLDRSMEGHEGVFRPISPEVEFWGHCSNLQAWVENEYDTRILHRNLAFPLLKRLTEVGDPKAKQVFKYEVVKRLSSGHHTVISYLRAQKYLQYLSGQEIDDIFDDFPTLDLQNLTEFTKLGSKKAKAKLRIYLKEKIVDSSIYQMSRYLSNIYIPYFSKEDLQSIFDSISEKIRGATLEDLKLSITNTFAKQGIEGANVLYHELVKDQIKQKNISDLLKSISRGDFTYFKKDEIFEIYGGIEFDEKKISESQINLLKHFVSFGIEDAKTKLSKLLILYLKTANIRTVISYMRNRYFTYLSKQEINQFFNSYYMENHEKYDAYTKLIVLQLFEREGISEAKSLFKQVLLTSSELLNIFNLEQIMRNRYLSSLTDSEKQQFFKKIDYNKLFNENFNRAEAIIRNLAQHGFHRKEELIREKIIEIFTNPTTSTLPNILHSRYRTYYSEKDLEQIISLPDSALVEVCFTLLAGKDYNIRNKIANFLKKIRALSQDIVSNRLITAIRTASVNSLCNLMRAKYIDLLTEDEKTELLNDPSCHLREFIVSYNGKEYHVDSNLGLNLSRKRITDLTQVKGLERLTSLKTLDIRGNNLTKIAGIGNLTHLEKLRLRGNNIPQELISHLGGVDRYDNALSPQKFVEYSRKVDKGELEHVIVKNKKIEVYSNDLVLRNLGIEKIEDIKGLLTLKDLRMLDLSHNNLKNIVGIEKLINLKILNLNHNQLEDIKGIERLKNLEELHLYGNGIFELSQKDKLKHLVILDLDTRRTMNDGSYLQCLFQSLNMENIKEICREYKISGYSRYNRQRLLEYTINRLSNEQKRLLIANLEYQIITEGVERAFKKINNEDSEYIKSIEIEQKKEDNFDIKITFSRLNWETTTKISVIEKNILFPRKYCECVIGSNQGFCSHFWVGFIFCLKSGYLSLSDWTMTLIPKNFEERLNLIDIITTESGEKRLINKNSDTSFLVEHLNTLVYVHSATLSIFEKRQYTWKGKIITYYLNQLQNVVIDTSEIKSKNAKKLKTLHVYFNENAYNLYQLQEGTKIKVSGQVTFDSYSGFLLKNIAILEVEKVKGEKSQKADSTISSDSEQAQLNHERIKIDLNTLKDDLEGGWWLHLSCTEFILVEKIPVIEGYLVNKDDILIHKAIIPDDRFPSIRYHKITAQGTEIISNNTVKDLLARNVINYLKNTERMPPNCSIVKEFKNGNVQVNYYPSTNQHFALKIIKNMEGIGNPIEFLKKARKTITSQQELVISVHAPNTGAQNQWFIESHSDPNKKYTVTLHSTGAWSCTCPHHLYRGAICKHIFEAQRQARG